MCRPPGMSTSARNGLRGSGPSCSSPVIFVVASNDADCRASMRPAYDFSVPSSKMRA